MNQLLSQYLSLEDIKRMGIPTDSGFFMGKQFLLNVCTKNYSRKVFTSQLIEEIRTRLYEFFPVCEPILNAFNANEITILMAPQKDHTFLFTYNYKEVLTWFFSYFIVSYPFLFSNYVKSIDRKLSDLAIENPEFADEVQDIFMDIFRKLNKFLAKQDIIIEQDRDKIIKDRPMAKYLAKHISELFEIFQMPITVSIPEDLDKDRLLLALNQRALSDLERAGTSLEEKKRYITFIDRYLMIVDYFVEKEKCTYNPFYFDETNNTFSYKDLKAKYQVYCDQNPKIISSCKETMEMDQIFRQYLLDARKKIKKEEFVKTIQLNFQFFPKGIGERQVESSKRSKIDENLRQLLREKHAKMLQDKIDFYSSTDYLWTLEEEQAFSGYRGYIYPNGKIVFDKFYNVTKEGVVPAFNESIITMELTDFIEMAPQSKSELLRLIHDHRAKSVRRFYHTPGWEDRIRAVIHKECVDYDFYLIENILMDISKEGSKVYVKSNS